MNTTSNITTDSKPAVPEVLRTRKRRWRDRLWVRVSLVLLLMFVISFAVWWWPRRTMVSVWLVNGEVYAEVSRQRTINFLQWWEPSGWGWGWQNFGRVYWLLSCTATDNEITHVNLRNAEVDDDWLTHLKGLPNIQSVGLHARQVGAGLNHLQGLPQLKRVGVTGASKQCLRELKQLPQIEDVSLWSPEPDNIGLETLAQLPKLKSLTIDHCGQTDRLLSTLPELDHLETLVFQFCKGLTKDGLKSFVRVPVVKHLDLVKCDPIDDEGLRRLSQLENLELLAIRKSWGQVSDDGLTTLGNLKKLKEMIVIKGDLSVDQMKTLSDSVPNAIVRAN